MKPMLLRKITPETTKTSCQTYMAYLDSTSAPIYNMIRSVAPRGKEAAEPSWLQVQELVLSLCSPTLRPSKSGAGLASILLRCYCSVPMVLLIGPPRRLLCSSPLPLAVVIEPVPECQVQLRLKTVKAARLFKPYNMYLCTNRNYVCQCRNNL